MSENPNDLPDITDITGPEQPTDQTPYPDTDLTPEDDDDTQDGAA